MDITIRDRKSATRWQKKYDASALKVGEIAPDFGLRNANGQNPVCLSDFRQANPVAFH